MLKRSAFAFLAVCGLGIVAMRSDACSTTPCVNVGAAFCRVESKTVKGDLGAQFTECVKFMVSNISMGCAPLTLNLALTAAQVGGPGPVAGITLGGDGLGGGPGCTGMQCVVLGAGFSADGQICVTFPAGSPAGVYDFALIVKDNLTGAVYANCAFKLCVTRYITAKLIAAIQDPGPLSCNPGGATIMRVFRITNCTTQARQVSWMLSSTQLTSSTPSDPTGHHDHFPIWMCGDSAPDIMDPALHLLTTPPTLSGPNALVPADGYIDVCVKVQSFPQCHTGSSCELSFSATDVASGEQTCEVVNYLVNNDSNLCLLDPDNTFKYGASASGSWGWAPTIGIWSPMNGSMIKVGTPFVDILLDNVPIADETITQPVLLFGIQSASIPLALAGAPGFELAVSPLLVLPDMGTPSGSTNPHYAEVWFSIPNVPQIVGLSGYAQWLIRDPTNNAAGVTLTQGAMFFITY